jgi:hypothetical protein
MAKILVENLFLTYIRANEEVGTRFTDEQIREEYIDWVKLQPSHLQEALNSQVDYALESWHNSKTQ